MCSLLAISWLKVTINNNAIVATNYQGEYDGLRKIFNSNVKEYVLGDEVTAIGDYAFANCDDMESIQISGNITSIGVRPFTDVRHWLLSPCLLRLRASVSMPFTIA